MNVLEISAKIIINFGGGNLWVVFQFYPHTFDSHFPAKPGLTKYIGGDPGGVLVRGGVL